MSPPDFKMFWHEEVPRVNLIDGQGQSSVVTVIAGPFGEQIPLSPPSASWAADAQAELAIWLIDMSAGAEIKLPLQPLGAHRVIYHVEGSNVKIGGATLKPRHGALMLEGYPHEVQAQQSSATLLVLQGRPIGEPVAQRGPFVMNTVDELRQAVYDYQRTQFGGWPWSRPDPVHDRKSGRFARYIDGREHRPPSSETQRGKHHITK
jgi:redox-sensitive bicupin YhaK (pirin superfamily)